MHVRFRDDSGHFASRSGRRNLTAEFIQDGEVIYSDRRKWTQAAVEKQLEDLSESIPEMFDSLQAWENAYDDYDSYEEEEWESSPDYGEV